MGWTDDQIAAMKSLGINPAYVPYVHSPKAEDGEPGIDQCAVSYLTDREFAALAPVLPPEPRQRGSVSNRQVIDALLWVHQTGKRFIQLPDRYGTPEAVRKRAERWAVALVWDRVLSLLDQLGKLTCGHAALRLLAEAYAKRGARIRCQRTLPDRSDAS